jgi:hypothetical protein
MFVDGVDDRYPIVVVDRYDRLFIRHGDFGV